MTDKSNLYERLLYINQKRLEANHLPLEQRAKLLKEVAAYYEKNLAEHNVILYPEAPNRFKEMLNSIDFL